MKKILVIGADGFIGGKLTTYLYLQGTEIIAMIPKGLKNYVPIQSTTIKYIEFDFDSILIPSIIWHGKVLIPQIETILTFSQ